MSRIGRKPVKIPEHIKVTTTNSSLHFEGPKGKLDLSLHPRMKVAIKGDEILVADPGSDKAGKSLFGLTRSLIQGRINGVRDGFTKELDIEGVGFRAVLKGKILELALGFTHPIVFEVPEGIQIKVDKQTHVNIQGADKQLVGQVAANIRGFYEPEPYKGKGVRYTGERIRRKQGKKVA